MIPPVGYVVAVLLGLAAILGGVAVSSSPPSPPGAAPPPPGAPPAGQPGRYFTWAELSVTSTGLPNVPTPEARVNLQRLVGSLLDPLRIHLGRKIRVNSGYRSPEVNAAVGGSRTSDHMRGNAADIVPEGYASSRERARAILDVVRQRGLSYDQIIWYDAKPHVHVSVRATGNRGEVLRATAAGRYVVESP